VNKAALLRRLDQLERQFTPPPSFAQQVLATATDAQLASLEVELEDRGECPTWDALVAAYRSGVGGS
jgi:hypothetical protein